MSRIFLYILLVSVTMIWGFNVVAIKLLVTYFSAVTITSLRILLAFVAIVPLLFHWHLFKRLNKKEVSTIILIAIFGVFGHQYFLSVGLEHSSATNGGLILGTVPIATTIAAAIALGDRLSFYRIMGFLLGFFGVAVIVLAKSGSLSITFGDLYFCLAVVTQAISFIMIKKVSNSVNSVYITSLSLLFGGAMLFALSSSIEPNGLQSLSNGSPWVWLVFIASGILASAFGQMGYNYAIQQIGPGKSALFLNLTPFFSLVAAYLFMGEKILISQFIGFILIVTGVLLGTGAIEQFFNKNNQKSKEIMIENNK